MKELICNSGGAALRVLLIFDPSRTAILLLGGGSRAIHTADRLYPDPP